jgi:hypothetical protein
MTLQKLKSPLDKTMKLVHLIIVFLFITISWNCKKDRSTTIAEGAVFESGTTKVVSGADVFLIAKNNNCLTCQGGVISTTKTDASGKFSFNFKAEDGAIYNLLAKKNMYFESDFVKSPVINPRAYLKLHIKNTQPFDPSDYINVVNSFIDPPTVTIFYGMQVDTFAIGEVCGNRSNNVMWFVEKNSIKSTLYGQVLCPAFDTTTYDINY